MGLIQKKDEKDEIDGIQIIERLSLIHISEPTRH